MEGDQVSSNYNNSGSSSSSSKSSRSGDTCLAEPFAVSIPWNNI